MLNEISPIRFPPETPARLIVVVDTEEEFDWGLPPDSKANTVEAIRKLPLVQDIFNQYAIKPCYVVDYPIASQALSIDILKPILDKNQCDIGTHLQPWVSPPFDEELTFANMYPGNLDYDLEYKKLSTLTETIYKSFGIKPVIYKAGRYGLGENTTKILHQLGYGIDLSVCPAFDYRDDGGPDFSDYDAQPYWFGPENTMLEIPLSGALVGIAGNWSKTIYNLAGHFNRFKARGILSRLNVVDRLMLSPEGYSVEEHIKLTRFLYKNGVRTFTWNFHSPSVVPGMTMYTQTDSDVENFLDSFRRYFDFFFDILGGEASTPSLLKKQLENLRSKCQ